MPFRYGMVFPHPIMFTHQGTSSSVEPFTAWNSKSGIQGIQWTVNRRHTVQQRFAMFGWRDIEYVRNLLQLPESLYILTK